MYCQHLTVSRRRKTRLLKGPTPPRRRGAGWLVAAYQCRWPSDIRQL